MSTATLPAERKIGDMLSVPKARTALENALGGSLAVDYFIAQMNIAFNKDAKLRECSLQSKYESANICATLGLLPTLGQVALIPRAGVCTVMPQWQGFQTLMMRCEEIKSVKAVLIHSMDTYVFDAETEQLAHTFDPFAENRNFVDWKDVKGGYLVVTYRDGRPKLYHCVSVETMKKARRCAQADNIWKAWFQEQCLKTVYRNAFARRVIPMDLNGNHRMERLIEATDRAEGNDPALAEAVDPPPIKALTRVEQVKQARPAAQAAPELPSEYPESGEQTAATTSDPIGEYMEAEVSVPIEKIDSLRKAVRAAWPKSTEVERLALYRTWGIDDPASDASFDLYVIETAWAAVEARNEETRQ